MCPFAIRRWLGSLLLLPICFLQDGVDMCVSHEQEGKFSIWFVNYKNNDEYKKKLMACNLIGGWFQR